MAEEELLPYYRFIDLFSLSLVTYFFILSWVIPIPVGSILSNVAIGALPTLLVDKLLLPLSISFFWLLVISQERERFARGLLIFKNITSRLSFFQKAFYGLNFCIALFLMLLPIVSIGLTFFLLFYLPYLVARKYHSTSKKISSFIFVAFFLLLGIFTFFPLLKLTSFLTRSWLQRLFSFWIGKETVTLVYSLSLSIGASGSVASFLLFVYEGAHEYDSEIEIPYFKINFGGFMLTLVFSSFAVYFTFFNPFVPESLLILLSILVLLYPVESVIRMAKGVKRKGSPLGKASLLLFFFLSIAGLGSSKLFISLLEHFHIVTYPRIIKIASMLSATVIFSLTFLYSLKKASKNY
ncbi:MAG: hypothetical protein GWO20_19985 [Candidatus Korarchaeota archaeon]|nr:hypothetical protein [Candidatus Korarchaeota archaeon]NIU85512.1 hypothetical protein [Candidatus Thorarchaeota archaeon]NIW15629.1 hypothetical protein [Candidatus Thorarchaeota archaeon]NIW53560.1 hypothetical protein [Candidatus Korarchaeota archaeon]